MHPLPPASDRQVRSGPHRGGDRRRPGLRHAGLTVAALAGLAACGESEGGSTAMVRDSAGVTIVESGGPAWAGDDGWRLSASPTLSIGVLDGPEEQQFTRIRNAFFLDDGRIVVANALHPPEIRVFSPDARHLASMGGAGEGPGELGMILWVRPAGDSLVVLDGIGQRLTFFGVEGELLGTVPVQVAMTQPMQFVFWTRLDDGSLLGHENRIFPADARGRGRAAFTLVRFAPDGSATDTVAIIPGFEYDVTQPGQGGPVRFGLHSSFLVDGGRLYVGAGDALRVDVQDLDGRLLRSIRAHHDRRPVRQADLDALVEMQLARARSDDARARIRQNAATMTSAELMPAHGPTMLVDALDHLWVEAYHTPADEIRQWHVFDPEGRYLGVVDAPRQLRVVDVAADRVLGIWTDDLDVESVRVYRLSRVPGG